jgi:hypothetical protein
VVAESGQRTSAAAIAPQGVPWAVGFACGASWDSQASSFNHTGCYSSLARPLNLEGRKRQDRPEKRPGKAETWSLAARRE